MERTPELYAAFAMSAGVLDAEPAAGPAPPPPLMGPPPCANPIRTGAAVNMITTARIPRPARIDTSGVLSQNSLPTVSTRMRVAGLRFRASGGRRAVVLVELHGNNKVLYNCVRNQSLDRSR